MYAVISHQTLQYISSSYTGQMVAPEDVHAALERIDGFFALF